MSRESIGFFAICINCFIIVTILLLIHEDLKNLHITLVPKTTVIQQVPINGTCILIKIEGVK